MPELLQSIPTIETSIAEELPAAASETAAINKETRTAQYTEVSGDRDSRIDFMRGVVMFILVIVHVEIFSAYNFVAWERFGVISGAEGFVILSGYATGMVSRRRSNQSGSGFASRKLFIRALQLWVVNISIICLVALLRMIPHLDVTVLTTFKELGSQVTYSLYPTAGAPVDSWLFQIAFLRIGPHQTQVLGLYVLLLPAAPLFLRAMSKGFTGTLLTISWLTYIANSFLHLNFTGCEFENAFPLFTWQVLFVNGMALGYHRAKVIRFLYGSNRSRVLTIAGALSLAFFLWAQNTPNPLIPGYARLSYIPADIYRSIYDRFMQKSALGPLRLLNYGCALVVGYAILTRFWSSISRWLGWFFIPLGQASLYVFVVHIAIVFLINMVHPFNMASDAPAILVNTMWHTVALASIWLLVHYRVLFRWLPR